MHTYVCCSTVYNSKDMERTKMSINDRLDKENVIYRYTYTLKYYAAIQRNEVTSFAGTWMKLEAIVFSKLPQEQETKHPWSCSQLGIEH